MTQDEIIRMAVKCQLLTTSNRDGLYAQALEAFAELVAEKERESCARLCEAWQEWGTDGALLAKAIRARGNT
jgi:hypothetical protein